MADSPHSSWYEYPEGCPCGTCEDCHATHEENLEVLENARSGKTCCLDVMEYLVDRGEACPRCLNPNFSALGCDECGPAQFEVVMENLQNAIANAQNQCNTALIAINQMIQENGHNKFVDKKSPKEDSNNATKSSETRSNTEAA